MKRLIPYLFLTTFINTNAQTTITLQPGGTDGNDAFVWTTQPSGNFGDSESLVAYTWTNGGNLANKRFLLRFDLSCVPVGSNITDAKLSLYHNPTDNIEGFDEHSGTNDITISRVTAAWNEATLNWNNQPGFTTMNQITLPPSSSGTQDYTDIDVTDLVADMVAGGNHGFLVKMVNENSVYRSVLFASSENPNEALRPKLELTYEMAGENCNVYRPGTEGKDAFVWTTQANNNFGDAESLVAYTWTNSGNLANKRFLMEFDMECIPSDATVTEASLSLYYNPTDNVEGFDEHSGSNGILIQRVTESWDELNVTWNNQPSITTLDEIALPPSSNGTMDYIDIDVTGLVAPMVSEGNHGFRVKMQNENSTYRSVLFASSDHPTASLHPQLEVCWTPGPSSTLEKETEGNRISVYPNPSNDGTFTLQSMEKPQQLVVINLLGEIIPFTYSNGQISISQKGVFVLTMLGEHGAINNRVKLIVR